MAWSGLALAKEAKGWNAEAPADAAPDSAQERSRAQFAERQTQQDWLAANAESQKTTATVFRFLARTVEEKAAWERVAKVAAKQAAAAKEMKEAWVRLERAEQLGPKAKTAPKERGRTRVAEVDDALKQTSAKGAAQGEAWEAWERARDDLAKLPEPDFDPDAYLAKNTPSARAPEPASEPAPTSAPAPRHSWWCATNFFNQSEQICRITKDACESMDSATMHYKDCREVETVTILEFTQVNGGRYLMAFPLLSQCEKKRKALMKNKVDYRDFSRCYSSAVSSP
jgi:hypothetical protein